MQNDCGLFLDIDPPPADDLDALLCGERARAVLSIGELGFGEAVARAGALIAAGRRVRLILEGRRQRVDAHLCALSAAQVISSRLAMCFRILRHYGVDPVPLISVAS